MGAGRTIARNILGSHRQGLTIGLSKDKIIKLGRLLDINLIILIIGGRLLESGFRPSKSDSSVVQVRLYAQDAQSGELFWSNRGEFEVTHPHGFASAPGQQKALFDRATHELIDALMADFFGER